MKHTLLLIVTFCLNLSSAYCQITWSAPQTIATANITDPQVTIDTNGNITAIWVDSGLIKASTKLFGGNWGAPVTISSILQTSSNPRLKINSSGTATAVWIGNNQVQSATRILGALWVGNILAISSSGATSLNFDMDSNGNAVAIWVRNNFVESATRLNGIWSAASTRSATNSSNPDIAINNSGTAIAAWKSIVSGSDLIVTSFLTVSSNTWGTTKNVFSAAATYQHNYPKVAIDQNANASVIWFRYNFSSSAYTNVILLVSSLPVTSPTWSIPTVLTAGGSRNPADLTLKIKYDINGNAIALWTNSYDGESFSIESSRQLLGGTWQPFTLLQGPSIYSFAVDLSLAASMAITTNMAWNTASNMVIRSQETDVSNPFKTFWIPTRVISTGSNNAYPKCAISLNGSTYNAVAIWVNFDGVNTTLKGATGTDTQIISPTNVVASQNVTNFGALLDYYNTITWLPSTDPKLMQYSIYRNGIFFKAVDPSTLQITDHNQTSGGRVTYGISTLTTDYVQSPVASFTLFP